MDELLRERMNDVRIKEKCFTCRELTNKLGFNGDNVDDLGKIQGIVKTDRDAFIEFFFKFFDVEGMDLEKQYWEAMSIWLHRMGRTFFIKTAKGYFDTPHTYKEFFDWYRKQTIKLGVSIVQQRERAEKMQIDYAFKDEAKSIEDKLNEEEEDDT
jgi:hypothetical protein